MTVKIGLGRGSALKFLFERYVQVCNEHAASSGNLLEVHELEFVHTTVLHPNDNPEVAALMKNDRIRVRPDTTDERRHQERRHSMQRDSDRRYFGVLRNELYLGLDSPQHQHAFLRCADGVVVECPAVYIVRARCPWLAKCMDEARRRERGRQSIITVPAAGAKSEEETAVDPAAAHIENDDEYDDDQQQVRAAETAISTPSAVWVDLEDYPSGAVKLLLEYCFTNRVQALGLDAFLRSCKTTTPVQLSPVPPFSARRWPQQGEPTISLETALATIDLARTAGMFRLALQCEIAASHLVRAETAVSTLAVSTESTPILRRAATEALLHTAEDMEDDVDHLDLPPHVIPVLLQGVSECLSNRVVLRKKSVPVDSSAKDALDRERERQGFGFY